MSHKMTLVAVHSGKALMEWPTPKDSTLNAVWLSEGCHLLAAGGLGPSVYVWGLPEGDLVHRFPALKRVWALWGNDEILAIGQESSVYVRSLETGSLLYMWEQAASVYGLWGLCDGSYISSCGIGKLQTR